MKKYKNLSSFLLVLIFLPVFILNVYANSSWVWISKTRPHDVLPFVIIITLVIEFLFVYFVGKIKNPIKAIAFILLANILSFVAPYLFLLIFPAQPYSFEETLEHSPFYIVGLVYLIMTLVVELPIVYFALKKSTPNAKKLLYSIIGSNILTTVLTAIVERVFCSGSW